MVLQAEVARKDHLRSLRAALTKRCKQAGFDGVGGSIFDKTLFALLRFTQQDEEVQNDPLIPFLKVLPASEGRKVMVEELARAGMKARAEAIVDVLIREWRVERQAREHGPSRPDVHGGGVPLEVFRKNSRFSFRFMDGYRRGLEGPLLDWANKKFSGKRCLPLNLSNESLVAQYEQYKRSKEMKKSKMLRLK